MSPREERVRFCNACNAVVSWYADLCDECGAPTSGDAGAAPPRTQSELERDLFRAHMRLIHRFKEEAAELQASLRPLETQVQAVLEGSGPGDPGQRLVRIADELLAVEERWGEVQRAYNLQSESIEEEFLARVSEMEVDLELTPAHQDAVNAEIGRLQESLEAADLRMRELARLLDQAQARRRSGILGLGRGAGGRRLLVLATLCLHLAGGAFAWTQGIRDPAILAAGFGPGLVGLLVLLLPSRS
jgi:hypothetical protein